MENLAILLFQFPPSFLFIVVSFFLLTEPTAAFTRKRAFWLCLYSVCRLEIFLFNCGHRILWCLFALTNLQMKQNPTQLLLWLLIFLFDTVPFICEKSMKDRAIKLMQDTRLIDGYVSTFN